LGEGRNFDVACTETLPPLGASWLEITQWLKGLSTLMAPYEAAFESKEPLRGWAKRRIKRLHDQFQIALRGVAVGRQR